MKGKPDQELKKKLWKQRAGGDDGMSISTKNAAMAITNRIKLDQEMAFEELTAFMQKYRLH